MENIKMQVDPEAFKLNSIEITQWDMTNPSHCRHDNKIWVNLLSQKIDQHFTKDKKGFGFGENAVQKFIVESFNDDSETSDEIKLSESLAFAFSENESSNENYFGPVFIGTDEDGNRIESPSIAQVTSDMIDYWETRGGECENPLLRARYLGLVWHLKKLRPGNKTDIEIAQNYLDALIEIANGDYYNPSLYVYPKLKHGLDMAVSFKDTARITAFVTAIIEFEKRHAEDDKAGTWGQSFDFFFDKKGIVLSPDEESSIITDLEDRLNRLEKMSDTRGVELCGKRIAKYHLKHNRLQDARDLILRVGAVILHNLEDDRKAYVEYTVGEDGIKTLNVGKGSAFQHIHALEDLLKLYHEFNIRDFDDKIMNQIREREPETLKFMMPISSEIKISQEELDIIIAPFLSSSTEKIISNLILHFIPSIEEAKKHLSKSSKKFRFMEMLSQTSIDHKGRAITSIGGIDNDPAGHLVLEISQTMQIQSVFLDMTLSRLFEDGKLSTEDILGYIKESPFIETDRHEIIKRGLKAYSEGDYVVSIHLLIPQIENAIRNVVAQTGGNPYFENSKSGGRDLKIFDVLLREPNVESIMEGELAQYFRILFTDRRGWNLRNTTCHGMAPIGEFTEQKANRVVHAFLCIAILKLINQPL